MLHASSTVRKAAWKPENVGRRPLRVTTRRDIYLRRQRNRKRKRKRKRERERESRAMINGARARRTAKFARVLQFIGDAIFSIFFPTSSRRFLARVGNCNFKFHRGETGRAIKVFFLARRKKAFDDRRSSRLPHTPSVARETSTRAQSRNFARRKFVWTDIYHSILIVS